MGAKRKKPGHASNQSSLGRSGQDAEASRGQRAYLFGSVDPNLLQFLYCIAELLVTTGIDFYVLQDHLQRAYVTASSGSSRFRNKRPNQSGIAAMTGLTRLEVKRLLEQQVAERDRKVYPQPRGVEKVVHGWISDPQFLDKSGNPLDLPRGKGEGTFDSLVAKYGNDVPVAAVKRELVRRKLVVATGRLLALNDPEAKRSMSLAAKKLISAASRIFSEVGGEENGASFETQGVTLEVEDELSIKLLRAHLASAVPIFFEQARIAAGGVISSPRKKTPQKAPIKFRLELLSLSKKADRMRGEKK